MFGVTKIGFSTVLHKSMRLVPAFVQLPQRHPAISEVGCSPCQPTPAP